jgi:hypothetical protein
MSIRKRVQRLEQRSKDGRRLIVIYQDRDDPGVWLDAAGNVATVDAGPDDTVIRVVYDR